MTFIYCSSHYKETKLSLSVRGYFVMPIESSMHIILGDNLELCLIY